MIIKLTLVFFVFNREKEQETQEEERLMEEKKKKKQEEKKKKEGAQKKVWLKFLLHCLCIIVCLICIIIAITWQGFILLHFKSIRQVYNYQIIDILPVK